MLLSNSVSGQIDPVGKDNVAIGGYDVVSYFTENKAAQGNPEIKTRHNSIIYYFSTAENRDAFVKLPEKYIPQYDGWCALAIGVQRKRVNIDPNTFRITNGKLYLFYNGKTWGGSKFNSMEPWIKDEDNLIKKSDDNWIIMNPKKK